ncbi:hypothetical protein [Chromobacterium sp. ASV23]|uniref:hypothetical protein n=1 Tax=Chromobacterium sp. ASV23 TaxID=2795110 RepID=UPI0018ECDDB5|nr:hypothetical protein [Chromobacterium sp. ASV23]
MKISNIIKKTSVAISAAVLAVPAFADGAAGPDYSSITSSVNAGTVVTGIAAIAGVMMLPRVAKWGFRTVMSMIK